MQISVSFTDHQKLSTQAYIDNIHISFLKKKKKIQKLMWGNWNKSWNLIHVNGMDMSL